MGRRGPAGGSVSTLRAGASGFLVKDTQPTELLHAVRVAAHGDALLSVLALVAAGLSNQEIPRQITSATPPPRPVSAAS